jgi:hypothetical protein
MYNVPEIGKSFSDIYQDTDCIIHGKFPAGFVEVLTKGLLRTWHDQNVVVLPLASIKDRDDVRTVRNGLEQ